MPAFSRGLRPLFRTDYISLKSTNFSTTSVASSGHNRWSKIKHDKGAVDAKKTKARSIIAHDIALAVKLHGADPYINPRLATVLATAKKAGFPKNLMETAIARGQGKSTTGAALQKATLEYEKNLGIDDVMDEAIEAGAEDLEVDDDGNIIVWTEPKHGDGGGGGSAEEIRHKNRKLGYPLGS
ncbi:hypothetical protein DID88_010147 [Monilinia fructigena]|uniref:Uncharacterized protein n=1 Tax=Monilinia fructigena TaxID=38457 RepID=A0A395IKC4_9HELO|nr:hypothetical protein DID88_010147 [Monilinia fructigena]